MATTRQTTAEDAGGNSRRRLPVAYAFNTLQAHFL